MSQILAKLKTINLTVRTTRQPTGSSLIRRPLSFKVAADNNLRFKDAGWPTRPPVSANNRRFILTNSAQECSRNVCISTFVNLMVVNVWVSAEFWRFVRTGHSSTQPWRRPPKQNTYQKNPVVQDKARPSQSLSSLEIIRSSAIFLLKTDHCLGVVTLVWHIRCPQSVHKQKTTLQPHIYETTTETPTFFLPCRHQSIFTFYTGVPTSELTKKLLSRNTTGRVRLKWSWTF